MAPDPVPRSTTKGAAAPRRASSSRATSDDDLRLGPGDEDPPVDHQVEGAEGPVAEDVLDRLTR